MAMRDAMTRFLSFQLLLVLIAYRSQCLANSLALDQDVTILINNDLQGKMTTTVVAILTAVYLQKRRR